MAASHSGAAAHARRRELTTRPTSAVRSHLPLSFSQIRFVVISFVSLSSPHLFLCVQDRVTRNKIVFLPDRASETSLQMLSLVVGSLDRVPYESGVPGAATVFDPNAYIRHDPLSEPRPTQPRVHTTTITSSHSDTHMTVHADTEQRLQTSTDKRPWWAVWK